VRRLTAREIVAVWDAGTGRSAVGQVLAMAAACLPDWSVAELAALPLGFRDALLLELHGATFGPALNAISACPHCATRVEFAISLADLPARPSVEEMTTPPAPLTLLAHGRSVTYRLPDSTDLAAIAGIPDLEAAVAVLARRCVLSVRPADDPADGPGGRAAGGQPGTDAEAEEDPLPAELVADLEAEMARSQLWADIELALSCPACGSGWEPAVDVGAFVWAEIESEGRRLLYEVDAIARMYGWSERDILDMPPVRRQRYLAMAS
jgi:hypothetical protein